MDDHRNRTIRVMLQHAFDEYWKFVHDLEQEIKQLKDKCHLLEKENRTLREAIEQKTPENCTTTENVESSKIITKRDLKLSKCVKRKFEEYPLKKEVEKRPKLLESDNLLKDSLLQLNDDLIGEGNNCSVSENDSAKSRCSSPVFGASLNVEIGSTTSGPIKSTNKSDLDLCSPSLFDDELATAANKYMYLNNDKSPDVNKVSKCSSESVNCDNINKSFPDSRESKVESDGWLSSIKSNKVEKVNNSVLNSSFEINNVTAPAKVNNVMNDKVATSIRSQLTVSPRLAQVVQACNRRRKASTRFVQMKLSPSLFKSNIKLFGENRKNTLNKKNSWGNNVGHEIMHSTENSLHNGANVAKRQVENACNVFDSNVTASNQKFNVDANLESVNMYSLSTGNTIVSNINLNVPEILNLNYNLENVDDDITVKLTENNSDTKHRNVEDNQDHLTQNVQGIINLNYTVDPDAHFTEFESCEEEVRDNIKDQLQLQHWKNTSEILSANNEAVSENIEQHVNEVANNAIKDKFLVTDHANAASHEDADVTCYVAQSVTRSQELVDPNEKTDSVYVSEDEYTEGQDEEYLQPNGACEETPVDDSFDRISLKNSRPNYAYVDVVRKHDERAKLDAFACYDCKKYFESLGLSDQELRERMKHCRHKARQAPPSTPAHYWSIGFIETQAAAVHTTQVAPSKFRRKRQLKNLFEAN